MSNTAPEAKLTDDGCRLNADSVTVTQHEPGHAIRIRLAERRIVIVWKIGIVLTPD